MKPANRASVRRNSQTNLRCIVRRERFFAPQTRKAAALINRGLRVRDHNPFEIRCSNFHNGLRSDVAGRLFRQRLADDGSLLNERSGFVTHHSRQAHDG